MLGTTPEDIAQFLHQEERLDSVSSLLPKAVVNNSRKPRNTTHPDEFTQMLKFQKELNDLGEF